MSDTQTAAEQRIPVTVLTGFLGSGKTTLLNNLVKHPDMGETAVLINDFSPTGASDIAKKMNAKQVEVISDTVELMERRERAIAEMGPIVAGQR